MDKYRKILIIGLVVFVLFGQYLIFGNPRDVWLDEAFSLEVVHKLQYEGLRSITWSSFDVHPPAYYISLYIWEFMRPPFITESQWGRELSLVAGVLFFIVAWIGLKRFFNEKEATFAILSMMCLSAMFHYFTEMRMYSFAMLLAALFFTGMSFEFAGNWVFAGMAAALLLPWYHYFAIGGFLYLMVMASIVLFIRCREDVKVKRRLWLFGGLFVISAVGALWMMLLQVSRVPKGWLPVVGFMSWVADVMSQFAYADTSNVHFPAWVAVSYLLMLGFIVFTVISASMLLKRKMSVGDKVLLLMVATIAGPILAELLISMFGPQPRYFLVVMWMFLAATGIFVARRGWIVKLLYVFMVASIVFVYFMAQRNELTAMQETIGCSAAVIVHDNTFSYFSFEVKNREYDCGWADYVSSDLSKEFFTSQGGDIADPDNVLWGKSVPNDSVFYIIGFNNSSLMYMNGTYVKLLYDRNWSLVRFSRIGEINLSFDLNLSGEVNTSGMVFVEGYGFVPANRVRIETYEESCNGSKKGWCVENGSDGLTNLSII